MRTIKKIGNITEYYIDNRLSLTITELGDNKYITDNSVNRIEGECIPLDEYRTQVKVYHNYTKGNNGRLYESKKLINHNASWFEYILEEMGFVRTPKEVTSN